MSHSKIGDLPELIYENKIVSSTLHSCISKIYSFFLPKIMILLHNSNDDDFKTNINFIMISFRYISQLNYPRFIKCLNVWKIISSIGNWVKIRNTDSRYLKHDTDYFKKINQ